MNRSVRSSASVLLIVISALMLAGTAGAVSFDLGVTPTTIIKDGTYEPGERFYGEFFIISGTSDPITVGLESEPGRMHAFRRLQDDHAPEFSEQPCGDCVALLQGEGELNQQRFQDVSQWRKVAFFVDVPDDLEPGYHLIEMMAVPQQSGGDGGVGVVSAPTIPLIFQVAGQAIRSGKVLGITASQNIRGNQQIDVSFYNNGTVTVQVDPSVRVTTIDGTATLNAGERRVPPGTSETFTMRIERDRLNDTFEATAIMDYDTGKTEKTATLRAQKATDPVLATTGPDKGRFPWTLVLIALVAVSTVATMWVIRDA